MELWARQDTDPFQDRHYQVPRPSDNGGIKAALRESYKPAAVPADLARLLSRLG